MQIKLNNVGNTIGFCYIQTFRFFVIIVYLNLKHGILLTSSFYKTLNLINLLILSFDTVY